MKNDTTIKVPKKYQHMIEIIYKDSDGYWAETKDGYFFPNMECHTAHEDTQTELLAEIRTISVCDCEECKGKTQLEKSETVREEDGVGVAHRSTDSSILDRFFSEWEAETIQWFWWMQCQYHEDSRNFKEKVRSQIGKAEFLLISLGHLLPRKGCGKSIQEIVADDMAVRKAKLIAKIKDKVGEITQLNLYCGDDGTPNGVVAGTDGAVRITTVVAGGYNIQRAHYRVLVR